MESRIFAVLEDFSDGPAGSITRETLLPEAVHDSLEAVELLITLEQVCRRSLEEPITNLRTVGDLVDEVLRSPLTDDPFDFG